MDKNKDNSSKNGFQPDPGIWVSWVKPYLSSLLWLFFVVLFAYLSIAVDYFLSNELITFFKAYAKTQSNALACVANIGFLFFAGADYLQTHKRNQKYELQVIVVVTLCISLAFTILLPIVTNYIDGHNGVLHSRGNEYSIVWLCYMMHSIYLLSLLILRGETQRVRSMEDYITTYKNNQYQTK